MSIDRKDCETRDRNDPIAFARERFLLPDAVIYLDGNSLGALPKATIERLKHAVDDEWGKGLIRSWNQADWISLPRKLGARIAALLGAKPDEIVAADSTSVNLFKLLSAMVSHVSKVSPSRRVVLSEAGNFPTDLYIAQGILKAYGDRFELKLVDATEIEAALGPDVAVALLTQVDYRTGRLHDMAHVNKVAQRNGIPIIWDLSHSAGAVPIDLAGSGAQLAVGCGYKYLNGGPGAPAFLYVEGSLQSQLVSPLTGWFGHAAPFDFINEYEPAASIDRFQCGTPSVLAMQALDCGLQTFQGVAMADVRAKSLALSDLFWQLMENHCPDFGFSCVSPRNRSIRGSQLSFAHEQAYAVMQALIERGVIGDFRQPNLLRFGFTPLYTRYVDVWDAVMVLRDVMEQSAWQSTRFQQRNKVT
ncbi:MAG: kynureninase [Betaproteobacteria bacterium]|nr:kynureninase [Betaproteobacteria bacterium]